MFYPASAEKLKKEIRLLLDETSSTVNYKDAVGIVSPHAGYIYSGKTAAYAFNSIAEKEFDTVIIISPSHREYFPGISIYSGDAYKTPLGIVELNKPMISKLRANQKYIFEGHNGHKMEHAVEVQLPFLQMIKKDFTIVPVVMGDQRKLFVEMLAEKLAEVADEKTLIVASSDLSHFHSKEKANELDGIVEKKISEFDYEGLREDLESGKCEACGGGPIISMMKAAELIRKGKSKVLARTDSGEVTGDNKEVVGYLSAVIYS
jgi:MEMO1 family protein